MTDQHLTPRPRTLAAVAPEKPDELRAMLVRFTVALNRRRAYASEHPMVQQAEDALFGSLQGLLEERSVVTIGVAHRELLVDQEPVAHGGAAGRELAERLHRRGVGGLTLQFGLDREALRGALAWLAQEQAPGRAEASGAPVAPTDAPPLLAGLTIARVAYERLALTDEQEAIEADVSALWRTLASVAFEQDSFSTDAVPDGETEPSAESVGDAITARASDRRFVRRASVVMQGIAAQLRASSAEIREEIAARLGIVLQRLGDSSLAAIIRAAGNAADQRRWVTTIMDVLPVTAVVDWLERTARATDQQLSHHLLRILTKLAAHDGERRAIAKDDQSQFRATAQALVSGWELDDPNPIEHGALLDHVATRVAPTPLPPSGAAPARDEIAEHEREAPDEDAVRYIQMACEIDYAGPDALAAARELVAAGHTVLLFNCLAAAPGRTAATALRETVISPEGLRGTLLREPFDASSARALLAGIDASLAPLLLDLLALARVRSARRVLLNTLRDFGAPLAPLLLSRLHTEPTWYVVRNLLLLLRDVSTGAGVADKFVVGGRLLGFLDHAQEQVRIEALRLLLESGATREKAIRRALHDQSPRMVSAAIEALTEAAGPASHARTDSAPIMHRDVALRLMRLAEDAQADADVRVRAVRALAGATGSRIRDWLVAHVRRRTRFLRRATLADGPTIPAALELLAAHHAHDPLVVPILVLARRRNARDPRRLAVERANA
jgi:hypothetical protein